MTDLLVAVNSFISRCNLQFQDPTPLIEVLRNKYPNHVITPAPSQGYCSLTVLVGTEEVVQFRPSRYALDMQIVTAARAVHGNLAPLTRHIITLPKTGVEVYAMTRVPGVSYKELQAVQRNTTSLADQTTLRATFCRDLAGFMAMSWHNRYETSELPVGRVGRSLHARMKILSTNLPPRFRAKASEILRHMHRVETLPWVFTHGDLLGANMLIEPSTGSLNGVVDWGEAELLPFGTCFYGLEEVLGEVRPDGFQYYPYSHELKKIFWAELIRLIPELNDDEGLVERVELARDMGILLWYGIAFDDGRIDRVVEEGKDVGEIWRLSSFFDIYSRVDCIPTGVRTKL